MQKYILALLLLSNLSVAMTAEEANRQWVQEFNGLPSTFHCNQLEKKLARINELLTAGADANRVSDYGVPALMQATIINRPELVRILVRAGVGVNKTYYDSPITTLIEAVCGHHSEIVRILIEEGGADRTFKNEQGVTAADYANARGFLALAQQLSQSVKLP